MIPKKRKKVAIFGATGMLGSGVCSILKDRYDLILIVRNKSKVSLLDPLHIHNPKIIEFNALQIYDDYHHRSGFPGKYLQSKIREIGDIDYIVNAIGLLIDSSCKDPSQAFFINSALPHILAGIYGSKMIHITTDCAFNGQDGFPYSENSPKSPVDIYGLSKSLGEPTNCLTLRTSIIGKELEGFTGILEWFLRQQGKTIEGYAHHYWNGITTIMFGKICDKIISEPNNYPKSGIFHVFSNVISKYDMLIKFRDKYQIDCNIIQDKKCNFNRTLTTIYNLNALLKIPSFDTMLSEL